MKRLQKGLRPAGSQTDNFLNFLTLSLWWLHSQTLHAMMSLERYTGLPALAGGFSIGAYYRAAMEMRQRIGNFFTMIGGVLILAALAYFGFYWLRIAYLFLKAAALFLWIWGWFGFVLVLGILLLGRYFYNRSRRIE